MATAIFKTSAATLPGVLVHCRHALAGKPKFLYPGDTILVAQTKAGLRSRQKQIRYRMTFRAVRRDVRCETDAIWGKHWPWIVDCADARELSRPFDISDIQVTATQYAQGGTVVYVDPLDDLELQHGGYFDGAAVRFVPTN